MIQKIIDRGWEGIDPTESEKIQIKNWLKNTIIKVGSRDVERLEDIQILFPIEYGEYLDLKEQKDNI